MARKWTVWMVCCGLVAVPTGVSGQVEVGFDAGLTVSMPEAGDNISSFTVPVPYLRLGLSTPGPLSVESLIGFSKVSSGGSSFSSLLFLPGVNFTLAGAAGPEVYLRAEAGLNRASGGGDSETQYGVGGGVGVRAPVGGATFRLEGALDKWLENEDAFIPGYTQLRVHVGISVGLGGGVPTP